jgi:hypothetical protein
VFLFGVNLDIDTGVEEDLVPWGVYTFQDPNNPVPFYISSTSISDVGLQYIALLIDRGFKQHTVVGTTDGQNAVQLVAPDGTDTFIRGNVLFNNSEGGVSSIGDVFVGVSDSPAGGEPEDSDKVLGAYSEDQQSLLGLYTIPKGSTGLLTSLVVTTDGNSSGSSEIFLNTRTDNRPKRRRAEVGVQVSGSSSLDYNFKYPVRFSEKTDIWLSVEASNNNTALSGGFQLLVVEEDKIG